ncbi:E3 ubiquitin-protein ligase RFWD3 [Marchantia polymorpha subsp. ruderalis]
MTRIEACSSGAGPPPSKRLRLSRNRQACSSKRTPLESLDLRATPDQIESPSEHQSIAGSVDKEQVPPTSHSNQEVPGVSSNRCEELEQRIGDVQTDGAPSSHSAGSTIPGAPCSNLQLISQLGEDSARWSSCIIEANSCSNNVLSRRIGGNGETLASSSHAEYPFVETRRCSSLVDTEVVVTRSSPTRRPVADEGLGSSEFVNSAQERPSETIQTSDCCQTPFADPNFIVHGEQKQAEVEARAAELLPCSSRPVAETSVSIPQLTPAEGDSACREELGRQVIVEEDRIVPQSYHEVGCSSHSIQVTDGNHHEVITPNEDGTLLRTSEITEEPDCFQMSQRENDLASDTGGLLVFGSDQRLDETSDRALTSHENLSVDDVAANTLQTGISLEANETPTATSDRVVISHQVAVGLDSTHTQTPFEGRTLSGFNPQMVVSPGEIMESTEEDLTAGDVANILTRTGRIVQAIEAYSRSPDHLVSEERVEATHDTRNTEVHFQAELMSPQLMGENTAGALESTREVTAEDVANIYVQAGAIVLAANNWLALSDSARQRAIENININANWGSLLQENLPREASVPDVQHEPVLLGNSVKVNHKHSDETADQSGSRTQEPSVTDGLACPICMEPWTNTGEHRICSLACGHLFGKSCIKRWIKQGGRRLSKCPHCNKRAKVEDLRNIYVPHIAVTDGQGYEMAQEVKRLKSENEELKRMNAELQMEMDRLLRSEQATTPSVLQKVEVNRSDDLANARRRQSSLQTFYGRNERRRSSVRSYEEHWLDGGHPKGQTGGHRSSSSLASIGNRGLGENFILQDEIHLLGAKVFDMDAYSQMGLVSNKASNHGSTFGLTRISLITLSEVQYLSLPPGLGAIRDVRFSPSGKLALVSSLGKRLSLYSLESNNIVINYALQSAPWSCAWDPSVPNQVYAGLQNGSLLIFDLRQTSSPIASVNGSSTRPVHTLQSVQSQTRKGILSASSSGAYFWDMGATAALAEIQRPQCISEDYREKLCVSLAYAPCLKTAVASFRPSPLAHSEASSSANASIQADFLSQPCTTARRSLEPVSSTQTSTQDHPSHCVFSSRFEDSLSESTAGGKVGRREWRWEGGKTMVGHKSTSVMPRSAIIVEPMSGISLRTSFACGDEGTNAVWLWDMNTLSVTQTLVPHQSPVLDVKYVDIGERILMGCISEKTFQLYRRPPSTV